MKKTEAATANHAASFAVGRYLTIALLLVFGLFAGVGVWSAQANLSGAVIAPGSFVVERNVRKVQHSTGGIIAAINVRNGDQVNAGDVLVSLDPTQVKAELGIIRSQSVELTARATRLIAERDLAADMKFPVGFKQSSPEASGAAESEERLFTESRQTRENQKAQLRSRIDQFNDEIKGLQAQLDAKHAELDLADRELKDLRALKSRDLVTVQRVNPVERDVRRLQGDRGSLIAQIARAKGQIAEFNLQIIMVDDTVRVNAQRDLRASEARLLELLEREAAAKDKFARIDIRSPITGLVHDLSVHTIGGVITGAEQLMLIVPEDEHLTVQARINPNDVDQVRVGRAARLRLSAFNQQQTPEVDGVIVFVAGDITLDTKTGQSYFLVRAEMADKAQKTVQGLSIRPGMPVEVFLATGDRTMLSYFMKPLLDQMKRAFRE